MDLSSAHAYGPYHLIVEFLGGAALATVLPMLAAHGTCVSIRWSAFPQVELALQQLLAVGAGTLYGLRMYSELIGRPASEDLDLLAGMVAAQQLRIPDRGWGVVRRHQRHRRRAARAQVHQ